MARHSSLTGARNRKKSHTQPIEENNLGDAKMRPEKREPATVDAEIKNLEPKT